MLSAFPVLLGAAAPLELDRDEVPLPFFPGIFGEERPGRVGGRRRRTGQDGKKCETLQSRDVAPQAAESGVPRCTAVLGRMAATRPSGVTNMPPRGCAWQAHSCARSSRQTHLGARGRTLPARAAGYTGSNWGLLVLWCSRLGRPHRRREREREAQRGELGEAAVGAVEETKKTSAAGVGGAQAGQAPPPTAMRSSPSSGSLRNSSAQLARGCTHRPRLLRDTNKRPIFDTCFAFRHTVCGPSPAPKALQPRGQRRCDISRRSIPLLRAH